MIGSVLSARPNSRACASPRSVSGESDCPCQRPWTLNNVSPWRTSKIRTGVPLIHCRVYGRRKGLARPLALIEHALVADPAGDLVLVGVVDQGEGKLARGIEQVTDLSDRARAV